LDCPADQLDYSSKTAFFEVEGSDQALHIGAFELLVDEDAISAGGICKTAVSRQPPGCSQR
jgi:hypothetical protein